MGFFGPIGCSAIFYLYVTLEFIVTLNPNDGDEPRSDVANLQEDVLVLVWFMVVCSVVSDPLGPSYYWYSTDILKGCSWA